MNRLIHADSSDMLLLGQQYTLIHNPSETVHMAVGEEIKKEQTPRSHYKGTKQNIYIKCAMLWWKVKF